MKVPQEAREPVFALEPRSILFECSFLVFLNSWSPLHLEMKQISVWQDL